MHTEHNPKSAIKSLVQFALDHDKECEETAEHTDDCPQHRCWDYRRELAARVMYELELDLSDLGFVAESLLAVEFEEGAEPAPDSVLEATEVGGSEE